MAFTNAGTTSWYKSAFTCTTDAGSTALWNEAATVAHDQLGYLPAKNVHLVLLFPSTADCGGAIGLGSIGGSVNSGGVTWVLGDNDSEIRKATMAHELGHNMSLGHADWLECASATPVVGLSATNTATGAITGCEINYYGDGVDVMGYGQNTKNGGALSSPQAIRASVWPNTWWTSAAVGTNSYILDATASSSNVAGHYHAIVVQDDDGVNYFVEYRNFTAGTEDAQYSDRTCTQSAGVGGGICIGDTAGQIGVRILRMEYSGFQGVPGYDSYLIGRTIAGVDKVKFGLNEFFWTKAAASGIKITVTALTATSATVQIFRATHVNTSDTVDIESTLTVDGNPRVGNTLTAFLGDAWDAESYIYQWKRDGSVNVGVNSPTYVVAAADLGHTLTVTVTGVSAGQSNVSSTSPVAYGPILAQAYDGDLPGAVTISNVTTPFVATPTLWPGGTAYTYQWYRGATATTASTPATGNGNATANYIPNVADENQFLRVKVTATPPGYAPTSRYSTAKDYTIKVIGGTLTVSGTKVGQTLSAVNFLLYRDPAGNTVTPTSHTYQWYRNATLIPGATGQNYVATAADYGYAMSVVDVASAPGWVSNTSLAASKSTPTVALLKGDIPATGTVPTITPGPVTLAASPISQSIVDPTGVTATYQWYRNDSNHPIAGATASTYKVSAVDQFQALAVKVTYSKGVQYNTLPLASNYSDFTLYAGGGFGIMGTPQVGQNINIPDLAYSTVSDPNPLVTRGYVWLRNNVAIPGATANNYTLVAADYNTAISVRVTATYQSYVPYIITSLPTAPVIKGAIAGSQAGPLISKNPVSLLLTSSRQAGDVTEPGAAYAYQWYRDITPIPGASGVSYQLAGADIGKSVWLRITVTKLNYVTIQLDSGQENHSVSTSDTATMTGTAAVGEYLSANTMNYYTQADGTISPTLTFSWLRNGAAIAGAPNLSSYQLVAADFGAKISYRVTAAWPGELANIQTSAQTPAVAKGTMIGTLVSVVTPPVGHALTAGASGITIPTGVGTFSYQWFRNAAPIAGATQATYGLNALDFNTVTWVRVTLTAPNYTTVSDDSDPINYSIVPTPLVPVITGEVRLGLPLTVNPQSYQLAGVGSVSPSVSYQWYRDGVAIAGEDLDTHIAGSLDVGKVLTVRVTAILDVDYFPTVTTSAPTEKVGNDSLSGWNTALPNLLMDANTNTLSVNGTGIGDGGVTVTYQWLRDGLAIPAATAVSYKLANADINKLVSVRVTISKPGYTSVVKFSTADDYTLQNNGLPYLYVSAAAYAVGTPIMIAGDNYKTVDGNVFASTETFQWLRNNVVIPGATGAAYTLTSADVGTVSSVRITATYPGHIANVSVAIAQYINQKGDFSGTLVSPDVTVSPTNLLTATLPAGLVDTPAPTISYQWLRNNANIVGATGASYQLSAAGDTGKLISVRVTLTKAGFNTLILPVPTALNYSITGTALPIVNSTDGGLFRVGATLDVTLPSYSTKDGAISVPPLVLAYQWYRTGVPIAGAINPTYTVASGDLAAKISVRVTASSPGYLPLVATSLASSAITAGVLIVAIVNQPIVTPSATGLLSVSLPAGTITSPNTTLSYKWFRGAVPAGTAATYQLTVADIAQGISVQVTVSKANVVPASVVLATSTPHDYSTIATGPATITGTPQVGSVLTAVAPGYSDFDGNVPTPVLTYQWYRGAVAIAAQTASTYTVSSLDVATMLRVRITAKSPGLIANVSDSAQTASVTKGVLAGSFQEPTVVGSGNGLLSITYPAGTILTPGVTFAYKWYRGSPGATQAAPGVAIAGAVGASYQMTSLDRDKLISVLVTVSKPGFQDDVGAATKALVQSQPIDYSIHGDANFAVVGTLQVGQVFALSGPVNYTVAGNLIPAPTITYQWYRNAPAVAIAGATGATYNSTFADLNKKLSVRVTVNSPGFLTWIYDTSTTPTALTTGVFGGDYSPPNVTMTSTAPLTLTATLNPGSIATLDGVWTTGYQWYRDSDSSGIDGVLIAGVTGSTYKPTAIDSGKWIYAKLTVSKPGYAAISVISSHSSYSLTPSGAGSLGVPKVGEPIILTPPTYQDPLGAAVSPTLSYVWLRNNVAIAGQIGASYTPVAADLGQSITAKVNATSVGLVPFAGVATAPQTVVQGHTVGSPTAVVTVTPATNTLTASLTGLVPISPTPVLTYQWYRYVTSIPLSTPIPGATLASYKLAAADLNQALFVKVTINRGAAFDNVVGPVTSAIENYTLQQAAAPNIVGNSRVGQTVQVNPGIYYDAHSNPPATPVVKTYQWFRQVGSAVPVAIAGATATTYALVAADYNTTITAKVTVSAGGYLGVVSTPASAGVIALGQFQGTNAAPIITLTAPATNIVTASLPAASVNDASATIAWQWMLDGVNIAGAVGKAATFKMTAANSGHITVLATVTRPAFQSPAIPPSLPANFTITASGTVGLTSTGTSVGSTVSATLPAWDVAGQPFTPTLGYQWFRQVGAALPVAIVGATAHSYPIVAADLGATLSVKVTTSKPGYFGATYPSTTLGPIVLGDLIGSNQAPSVTEVKSTMTLTAVFTPGSVSDTGITIGYQWLRDGVAILGATAQSYHMVAANDAGFTITVRLTVTKPGYNPKILGPSNDAYYTVHTTGNVTLSNTSPIVGSVLYPQQPVYDYSPEAFTYQWLRDGVAIPGTVGRSPQYTVVGVTDSGHQISLQLTAMILGMFPLVQTTPQTDPVP
ncbi:MAG TPA: zinc-dependent metalloprotease family protein [Pseudolysinimonas sp.]|nr:zinc-dependent metalloprotease family protein [Pseudolysinimonas sp.]